MKNKSCPNKIACWDYDASNCTGCALGEKFSRLTRRIKQLKSENAELRATLSKMETVEKELRDRLDNAVELPCVKMVNPKVRINRIGIVNVIREWAVIYIDRQGDFVVEHCRSKTAAEARLAELKGGRE